MGIVLDISIIWCVFDKHDVSGVALLVYVIYHYTDTFLN
jgi:hypothetical protein